MFFLNTFTVTNLLVFFTTLIFVLYLYFKWSYTYWSRKGVITPACSFPLGNLKDVALGRVPVQEMFKEMYTNLKPKGIKYFGYYFIRQPLLVVCDLELIKSIMVKDFSHFTDHGIFDRKDYDTFDSNLFSSKGAEWKKMRETLSPLLTSGKLKMMFSTIENCSVQLTGVVDQVIENGQKLDIKDIAGRYTTDIIASVAFGIEVNSLKNPNSEFRKYGERAVGNADTVGQLRLAVQFLMPDVTAFFKLTMLPADISNFFLKIVESTITYREENNISRKDFMQLMIQLKNNVDLSGPDNVCFDLEVNKNNKNIRNKKDYPSLSIEDIAAQTLVFFIAGFDTSSTTITFCMYELAYHRDIQEKLRDEINNVLKEHEGKLSYDAIMKMTYMDKCIKETLRKYPVVSSLFRLCTKTYQVPNSDLIIDKDTIVMIPAQEIHYDSEYHPNPEKFDPERFSYENISTRSSFTWIPFGEGPRLCFGMRLAMLQIKVALTTLVTNFKYTLDSKTSYPLKRAPRAFVVTAKEGIWFNVEKIVK